ncbi:hypothetical protein CP532_0239 [Ophiocordyceps camponoti-leonardi (nom. inval.)]|nr:hypothetical protein CP532_0239 [Ophiocordyceps camponoti-leonardi (nom. inval.)]
MHQRKLDALSTAHILNEALQGPRFSRRDAGRSSEAPASDYLITIHISTKLPTDFIIVTLGILPSTYHHHPA